MKNCIAHSLDGPPTAMRQIELGHRYGRCMCSRQFGDWRELRRPDQKRHYVTIALRRWSVTKTWTCRNLTMKNDDFEAVDFVQAIHISEDCVHVQRW
ncbi:hypothetical protein KCU96_g18, partial [Aureobasidium melanogenum]